jgi:hypothetical protein
MRFIAVPILILLLMSQTFSKWLVVINFNLNREYIAKNLCENRYRPVLKCNGNCVLMKKMKEEESKEQNTPAPVKMEASSIVLSSRSFFANAETLVFISNISYIIPVNSGSPVDRTASIFHPPSA